MNEHQHHSTQSFSSVAEKLNSFQGLETQGEKFEELSRDLVNNLFILLRASGLYDLDNQALEQPYLSLLQSISGLYEMLKSRVMIRLNDGNFFVNRRLVKVDFSTFQNTRYLIRIFNFLDINELCFEPQISRSDLQQLLSSFVRLVKEKHHNFKDLPLKNIEARKLKIGEIHPLLKAESPAEKVAAWYATACFVTQNFYQDSAEGRVPQHALLKRTVLNLLELPPRQLLLLSRLDLLSDDPKRGGSLFIQSVEAAGIVAFLCEQLKLDQEIRLAMVTAALQLFQGWCLLKDEIHYANPNATRQIFDLLESPREIIETTRNEMIRLLLDLGGVSESVIQRIMITFEAQRAKISQWGEVGESKSRFRPSRALSTSRLYSGGLGRSFLSDLVYGAHIYVHLRRECSEQECWQEFTKAGLLPEVKFIFSQLIGLFPYGSAVELSDQQAAIVINGHDETVTEIAIIESGRHPLKVKVKEQIELRPSSPLKVKTLISLTNQSLVSRESIRALLFSHLYVPSKIES